MRWWTARKIAFGARIGWIQEGLEREKKAKKGGAAVVERPKAEPKQMSKEEIANEVPRSPANRSKF